MTTPLHPRVRYATAAKKLLVALERVGSVFVNAGLMVPVEVSYPHEAPTFTIRWDSRRREFQWRPEAPKPKGKAKAAAPAPAPWRSIAVDVNHPDIEGSMLAPVVDLFTVLPEVYELAQQKRDEFADVMDTAAGSMEDWLKGLRPIVLEGGAS